MFHLARWSGLPYTEVSAVSVQAQRSTAQWKGSVSDQLDSPQGYWIRLGDGSLQHLEHLLTEEDFAHQYPDAYAYARSVRDLDPALLEAD